MSNPETGPTETTSPKLGFLFLIELHRNIHQNSGTFEVEKIYEQGVNNRRRWQDDRSAEHIPPPSPVWLVWWRCIYICREDSSAISLSAHYLVIKDPWLLDVSMELTLAHRLMLQTSRLFLFWLMVVAVPSSEWHIRREPGVWLASRWLFFFLR